MVEINKEKCTGCGWCAADCVAGNLALKDEKACTGGPCFLCGHCVAICPTGAVSIPEYEMSDVEAHDKDFDLAIGSLLHTVKFRRSIRQYDGRPVEREKLENIVQAGRYTATGVNAQGCRFIVVQDGLSSFKDTIWSGIAAIEEPLEAVPAQVLTFLKEFVNLKAQGTDYLFRDAPTVLYIAAESAADAALAAQNMELAAVAQGLGVLYNGFLKVAAGVPAACEWLGLTDKPVQMCMLLGYPRVTYHRTAPRRKADVRWL